MNVRELIVHLQSVPPGLRVVVSRYEYGLDELIPARVEVMPVSRNLNRPDYDDEFARTKDRADADIEAAVAVHRNYAY